MDVKVRCDESNKKRARCLPDPGDRGGPFRAGGALVGTSGDPKKEVDWCEAPIDSACQNLYMVHELAHTCGWRDNDTSKGVPHDLQCERL
jgi:hypothetical protein